jgi:hypothetical protein
MDKIKSIFTQEVRGWQRGDNTEQEWLDAVQAVKDAYPYPEVTK